MENNRNDQERNERSSWQNESRNMGSQNQSYGRHDENSEEQNLSGHDAGTGSSMQSQGMGSRGNEMNDPAGGESYRMNDADRSEDSGWGSGQSMSGRENMEDDFDSGNESQRMSGRDSEKQWESESGHNMSSGSAYLEEDVDRASRDMSGSRDHDYMENNGNSTSDYNLTSDLNEDWSSSGSQSMSGRDTDFDGGSHSQEMSSDDDDFNSSGFEDEEKSFADRRSSDSKTFNEDEDTWRHEQRMKGNEDEAGSGANYGQDLSNRGTSNNNWDANDQTQRGREWHDDEDEKNSLF